MSPSPFILLKSLPEDWIASDKILLLNFVEEGNGASIFTKSYTAEICKRFRESLLCFELQASTYQAWLENHHVFLFPAVLIYFRDNLVEKHAGVFPKHQLERSIVSLLEKRSDTLNTENI